MPYHGQEVQRGLLVKEEITEGDQELRWTNTPECAEGKSWGDLSTNETGEFIH